MAFNGTEGGQITLEQGSELTANYRAAYPRDRKGNFYGKDILTQLLNQQGCMGIRMYYGLDEDGNKELVLVGTDADENDLLEFVVDLSQPCPNRCGSSNSLNS